MEHGSQGGPGKQGPPSMSGRGGALGRCRGLGAGSRCLSRLVGTGSASSQAGVSRAGRRQLEGQPVTAPRAVLGSSRLAGGRIREAVGVALCGAREGGVETGGQADAERAKLLHPCTCKVHGGRKHCTRPCCVPTPARRYGASMQCPSQACGLGQAQLPCQAGQTLHLPTSLPTPFLLTWQPPYRKGSQAPEAALKNQEGTAARQGPFSAGWAQKSALVGPCI